MTLEVWIDGKHLDLKQQPIETSVHCTMYMSLASRVHRGLEMTQFQPNLLGVVRHADMVQQMHCCAPPSCLVGTLMILQNMHELDVFSCLAARVLLLLHVRWQSVSMACPFHSLVLLVLLTERDGIAHACATCCIF
jgi:hypothetical protein